MRRKRLKLIGFSSVQTDQEWMNQMVDYEIFHRFNMISFNFFNHSNKVFNLKFAQVNVLLSNSDDCSRLISESPLTKSLGLMTYKYAPEQGALSDDKRLNESILNVFIEILNSIVIQLNIDLVEQNKEMVLKRIKTTLKNNPEEIIKVFNQ